MINNTTKVQVELYMKVEIYGASWCHFCKEAVKLCKSNNIQYDYIDVDEGSNLTGLEERMGGKVRSIPQIYMNNELVPNGYNGLRQELAKA